MASWRRAVQVLLMIECVCVCSELLTIVGAVEGGEATTAGEFPHMALLGRPCQWGYRAGIGNCTVHEWFCGASLISNRFVLTAAHCAHTTMQNPPTVVRLGEHDLADGAGPPDRPHQDYAIRAIRQHPDYTGMLTYNDIALVELERTVPFTQYIRPACLWTEDALPAGILLIATGWGNVGDFEEPATVLQRVTIPLVPNEQCNQLVYHNRRLRNGIMSTQLCAGDPHGGKDTCRGDSGGPLQVLKPLEEDEPEDGLCRYHIVGVTSNGVICGTANQPGIYTRVSSYIDWIESVVWDRGTQG